MLEHSNRGIAARLLLDLVIVCAQPFAAEPHAQPSGTGHPISGRVVDSHGLVPSDVELMIGTEDRENSFVSAPVPLKGDSLFVTRSLVPAMCGSRKSNRT